MQLGRKERRQTVFPLNSLEFKNLALGWYSMAVLSVPTYCSWPNNIPHTRTYITTVQVRKIILCKYLLTYWSNSTLLSLTTFAFSSEIFLLYDAYPTTAQCPCTPMLQNVSSQQLVSLQSLYFLKTKSVWNCLYLPILSSFVGIQYPNDVPICYSFRPTLLKRKFSFAGIPRYNTT